MEGDTEYIFFSFKTIYEYYYHKEQNTLAKILSPFQCTYFLMEGLGVGLAAWRGLNFWVGGVLLKAVNEASQYGNYSVPQCKENLPSLVHSLNTC